MRESIEMIAVKPIPRRRLAPGAVFSVSPLIARVLQHLKLAKPLEDAATPDTYRTRELVPAARPRKRGKA